MEKYKDENEMGKTEILKAAIIKKKLILKIVLVDKKKHFKI